MINLWSEFTISGANWWQLLPKCAGISIKSAGVLKWVFENIRKRSKTFENIRKVRRNIRKFSENIQKFYTPLRI
jgi:accessory colonization factor AcfC